MMLNKNADVHTGKSIVLKFKIFKLIDVLGI